MKISDCCGVEPIYLETEGGFMESSDDLGICPHCKDHCEYINNDERTFADTFSNERTDFQRTQNF